MDTQSKNLIFTTSNKPNSQQIQLARSYAEKYNGFYTDRKRIDFASLDESFCFVIEKDGSLKIRWKDGQFFYHPSVAKIKYSSYLFNKTDPLLKILSISSSDTIVDLTMGLASEALFMAAFCKCVTGIEGSLPIYIIVSEGLSNYGYEYEWMKQASKKVVCIHSDLREYIRNQPNDSFDTVYCDPMFEHPKYSSSPINPLRKFAIYDPVTSEDVSHMLRIARKRVVIKARSNDSLWERFKFSYTTDRRKSDISFGVIEKQ